MLKILPVVDWFKQDTGSLLWKFIKMVWLCPICYWYRRETVNKDEGMKRGIDLESVEGEEQTSASNYLDTQKRSSEW